MIDVMTTEKDEPMKPQPRLKLITGGNNTPPSGGINWLRGLNKGAAFACKRKGQLELLDLYIVAFKHDKTVILVDGLNNNVRLPVDPEEFCKKYSLFELIDDGDSHLIEEGGEHPEEIENDSVRTLRPPSVEDDVDVEGGQPEHDGAE